MPSSPTTYVLACPPARVCVCSLHVFSGYLLERMFVAGACLSAPVLRPVLPPREGRLCLQLGFSWTVDVATFRMLYAHGTHLHMAHTCAQGTHLLPCSMPCTPRRLQIQQRLVAVCNRSETRQTALLPPVMHAVCSSRCGALLHRAN